MFTPIFYMQSTQTGSFTFIYVSKIFDNDKKQYRKITIPGTDEAEQFLILSPAKRLTTEDFRCMWADLDNHGLQIPTVS